jgi:hypothetical protein
MIVTAACLLLGSAGGALWKSIHDQPIPWTALIVIASFGTILLAIAITLLLRRKADSRSPDDENLFIQAVERLNGIYTEGDHLATLFQIPTAPRPTFSQVTDWDQKADAFVKRKIFEGCFTALDWERFKQPWSYADCQRIEKLLCRHAGLDRATDVERATFRYIWGRVKRLNQLIAKIKGLETDENKTPIEILTDFQIRGQGLSDEIGSAEPQPPYAGLNELLDEIRRFLRKTAPNYVDRFNDAVENPEEPVGNWPRGLTGDELNAWVRDKRRRKAWDVLNSVSNYLNQTIREFRSRLPS